MKKLLALMTVLLLVTGCGGSNNEEPSTNDEGKVVDEKQPEENKTEDETGDTVTLVKGTTQTVKSTYNDKEVEVELTYVDQWIANELKPTEPTSMFYSYLTADEGETLLITQYTVKNLSAEAIDSDVFENLFDMDGKCSAEVIADGKYTYNGYVVMETVDSDGNHDIDQFPNLKPLKEATFYYYAKVPEETKDMPMKANMCLGDAKVNFGE